MASLAAHSTALKIECFSLLGPDVSGFVTFTPFMGQAVVLASAEACNGFACQLGVAQSVGEDRRPHVHPHPS